MKVTTYIGKLTGEDLEDAFAYSLFAMANEQLQEVLESIPDSERQRLARCLEIASKMEAIRLKYEQACRKEMEDASTTVMV